MAHDIKIWNISKDDTLTELNRSKLDFERRLEDWIEQDISILSDECLVIGRQVPTSFGTFIDILCLDRNGDLVVIELKRDKTPRDTVAQALDYASWVTDLSREDVISIADSYFGEKESLESIFERKFHITLPDVLNASHTILVVASYIDSSTDRIVKYLSDSHGVGINIAEFQYFKDNNEKEYLSRVFLIEPEVASSNVERVRTSKRKPNLTRAEIEEITTRNGVKNLYMNLEENLREYFDTSRTTMSSLGFEGKDIRDWGRGVIFNILPLESSKEEGLKFQVYSHRFANYFDCSIEELKSILPLGTGEWYYEQSNRDEMWVGFDGYFKTIEDVEKFLKGLEKIVN